jgi:hypothetical protein
MQRNKIATYQVSQLNKLKLYRLTHQVKKVNIPSAQKSKEKSFLIAS